MVLWKISGAEEIPNGKRRSVSTQAQQQQRRATQDRWVRYVFHACVILHFERTSFCPFMYIYRNPPQSFFLQIFFFFLSFAWLHLETSS